MIVPVDLDELERCAGPRSANTVRDAVGELVALRAVARAALQLVETLPGNESLRDQLRDALGMDRVT